MCGFNTFIRSYFSFLDKRSSLVDVQRNQTEEPMVRELVKLKRICKGIARVLMGTYSAGKLEATMAFKILQRAKGHVYMISSEASIS
ncbi:hypothetical protein DKX38_015539 [Salix brachista]|uniref:Uncharacterized protein n=1 Tax=Salix brachista TaxID=2182728 RepID=A0A5N5L7G4_9ROSI|nr:hypothetical protein DKX38_015539 [Salix brachista]